MSERIILCPLCKTGHLQVMDSRPVPTSDGYVVMRRRRCRACGLKYETEEWIKAGQAEKGEQHGC